MIDVPKSEDICNEFLRALLFIVNDTRRDPDYLSNHLLSYLAQDYIQAVFSFPFLAHTGVLNQCRRELRFLIETSIKLCHVQQKGHELSIQDKLVVFKKALNSSDISIKNDLDLSLLSEAARKNFKEDIGRFYGSTSNYVHLTTGQINERIDAVDAGRTSGFESEADGAGMMILDGLTYSLVLLLHSVYEYVAGDLLVDNDDGASNPWLFAGSKYIAEIDAHFDYKHERKAHLEKIVEIRTSRIYY